MPKDPQQPATPPYASYASFKSFINGLGESTVPSRIDKTVMSNYSGSTQYALLPALQWLGLTDSEGTPSDLLKALSTANESEFGSILNPVIREKYGFLFSGEIDLESASTGQVEEAFKSQNISGSTVTKCISFFLKIANEAGIAVSPHVKAPAIKRSSPSSPKNRSQSSKGGASGQTPQARTTEHSSPPQDMEQFTIPIRGLNDGRVWLPKDLDDDQAARALRIIKYNLEQYYEIDD